ncbi:MAG: transglutaminase domain-containing protein, partial [Candidatus Micrarchaeota archaeon]
MKRWPMHLMAFFLAAAALCHGEAISPKLVGSATAIVELNWSVDLAGQSVSGLKIKSFGFKDYLSQDVLSEDTSIPSQMETDAFGNKILIFPLQSEQDVQSFGMRTVLNVGFAYKYRLELPGEREKYLKPSYYVKFTPEIRQAALQATEGIATDVEKLVVLTEWVHANLEYDGQYISFSKDSAEVFTERRGTCDEYSHLLIAMLRMAGIPAKFAASFVYSGSDWGAHAFVEALVDGKWVPVDPTFNEAMLLDATHIKFGEGLDQQDIKEDIVIRSSSADVGKVRLVRTFRVTFDSAQNFPQLADMAVQAPNYTVGEQSIETIMATVKNGANVIALPLSLNVPRDLEVLGAFKNNRDRLVLLRPFEEKQVFWKIKVPRLDDSLVYIYPVEVNTLGQSVNTTFLASRKGERNEQAELSISSLQSNVVGDQMKVEASVRNNGNAAAQNVVIVLSLPNFTDSRTISLQALEEKQVSFSAPYPDAAIIKGYLDIRFDGETIVQPIVVSLEEIPQEPAEQNDGQQPQSIMPSRPEDYALWGMA